MSGMTSSKRRPDDPISTRAGLPDDLIDFIKQRQKQLAPLCPRCGRRKIEDPKTGWCNPCSIEYRERDLSKKRRWWDRNRGRGRDD